jgi:magnesium-transporting ATPase (P-type)
MSVEASDRSVSAGRSPYPEAYEEQRGTGWMIFAGTILAIVGTLNFIAGIAAIDNSKFFVGDAKYMFANLNTWGWVALTFGVVQVLTAFGVWAGSRGAAWLGVGFASLNAIALLLALPSYPLFALALFSMDVLVIYGLVAYAGRTNA